MKKYILVFIALIGLSQIKGQFTTINPITKSQNAYDNISCDYGPRYLPFNSNGESGGSYFHPSIDYNTNPNSGSAFCVEAGELTLFRTNFSETNLIDYIDVGNWRYMHILKGKSSDGLWELLKTGTDETQDKIIIRNGNPTDQVTAVYATKQCDMDYYVEPGMTFPVTIKSQIPIAEEIFRANAWPGGEHLDLKRLPSSLDIYINPLSFLPRTDNAIPTISTSVRRNNDGIMSNFTEGEVVYGDVFIESEIEYLEKDLKSCILEIRKGNNVFKELASWYYVGSKHLKLTSKSSGTSNTPYHRIRRDAQTLENIRLQTEEGIHPVRNVHSKDVIKYKLIRENQNDQLNIAFNDGNYEIRTTATDLTDKANPPQLVSFTLDNFKPFIKKLEVHNILGNIVYSYEWKKEGSNLVLHEGGSNEVINSFLPVYIRFWTSEEITNPSVSFGGRTATFSTSSNDSYWQFECNSVTESSLHSVTISGIDKNGNAIFDMPQDNGQIALSDMPVRTGATFSNPGTPVETFYVVGCPPSTELKAAAATTVDGCSAPDGSQPIPEPDFDINVRWSSEAENELVAIIENNTEHGAFYYWDFGDGTYSTDENPEPHKYQAEVDSKIQTIKLEVTNYDNKVSEISRSFLIPATEGSSAPISVDIVTTDIIPRSAGDDRDALYYEKIFYLEAVVTNNGQEEYTYTYDWNFGANSNNLYEYANTSGSTPWVSYLRDSKYKEYFVTVFVNVYKSGEFICTFSKTKREALRVEAIEDNFDVTFSIETTEPNNVVLKNTPFKIRAKANGRGTHTFVWEAYSTDVTNPNPVASYSDFAHAYSTITYDEKTNKSGWVAPCEINFPSYSKEGEYLIKFWVNDYHGNAVYKEYIVNVVSEYGCGDLHMYIANCDGSQYKIYKNSTVKFGVTANLNNCGYSDEVGKIVWRMRRPSGTEKRLGCSYVKDPATPIWANLTKCIEFTESGIYSITADVYPYRVEGNGDITIMNRDGESEANDLRTSITKTVEVLDWKEEKKVGITMDLSAFKPYERHGKYIYKNILIEPGGFGTVYSFFGILGTIYEGFILEATDNITIKPPFHAVKGRDFTARIVESNVNCTYCKPETNFEIGWPHYYVPSEAITVRVKKEDCKREGGGTLDCSFSVSNDYGGPYYSYMEVYEGNDVWMSSSYTLSEKYLWQAETSTNTYEMFFNNWGNKTVYAQVDLEGVAAGGIGKSGDITIGKWSCKSADTLVIDKFEEEQHFSHESSILLYPNPTETQFTLEIEGDYTTTQTIEIFNKIGKRVFVKENNIGHLNLIDVYGWPEGVYFVRLITNEGKVEVKKLVKN